VQQALPGRVRECGLDVVEADNHRLRDTGSCSWPRRETHTDASRGEDVSEASSSPSPPSMDRMLSIGKFFSNRLPYT
jgi:hypothetical protein